MSDGGATRLEALFHQASELDAPAREALLRRVGDAEPALAARLRSLLAHDRAHTPASLRNVAPLTTTDPDWIDRYRILERIGEGGMGVVYLAEQSEPVQRRVALKVMRAGLDTEIAVARFAAERQALAMMDHPGIAHIFDAGATDQGRPYYVMEYTPGPALHTYCEQHSLAIAARLALFVQVCDAVQHAHQRGIVHRDLKPQNVLVTTRSGTAIPKVIDFGIARPASGPHEPRVRTRADEVIGTFDYMSPEQADGGGDVDTRTDIWSLGVMLYQLLTGRLPFGDAPLHTRSLTEVRTILREQEPVRPSSRVAGQAALARHLRGDLDWIVLRALAKDRAHRYASASEFAADVRRHLAGEPVLASPPSWRYRFRKFTGRHRVAVLAAGAVLAALTAGLIGTSLGLHRATTERARADERADALRRQLFATNVALAHAALQRGDAPTATRLLGDCAEDLRGFEWQWLSAAANRPRQRTALAKGDVALCMCAHADGRHVLVGTANGRLLCVDPDAGVVAAAQPVVADRLSTLTADRDGDVLVAGSDDGTWVRIDPRSFAIEATLAAPHEQVRMVAVAPTGRRLALLRSDGTIETVDLARGTRRTLATPPQRDGLDVLAWSADGARLAAGGADLCVFDVASGACLATVDEPRRSWRTGEAPGSQVRIGALAFAPDGERLAIGLGRHVVPGEAAAHRCELRDTRDLALLATLPVRGNDWLGSLVFRRSGREIVAAGGIELDRLLLRADRTEAGVPGHGAPIVTVVERPDGTLITASASELCAWPEVLAPMPDSAPTWARFGPAVWSRSRARVAVPSWLLGGAFVHDTHSLAIARALVRPHQPSRVLAIGDDDRTLFVTDDGRDVQRLDLDTGVVASTLAQSANTTAGCCAGRGTLFVGAQATGDVMVWRIADGTRLTTIQDRGSVAALVPWRDERAVAIARNDGRIERIDLDTSAVRVLGQLAAAPTQLVVHPDGRQVLVVDNAAAAWVVDGEQATPRCLARERVVTLDVSPDGRCVALADHLGVRLHDFATGNSLVQELHGSRGVSEVRFRADGSGLVGLGARIVVWDLHPDPATSAARAVTRSVHGAWERLRRRHVVTDAMRRHADDEALPPAEHAALLQLLARLDDSPQELNHEAWERVVRPNLPQAEYEYALVAATTAARIAPTPNIRNTLATALLRAGHADRAAALAAQLLDEATAAARPPSPFDLAVLTIARQHLGDRQGAEAAMAALRERLAPFLREAGDPQIHVFVREAEATLAR